MGVRKSGKGYKVVHCHGNGKGETISYHKTKAAALAKHRAIMAKKKKKENYEVVV